MLNSIGYNTPYKHKGSNLLSLKDIKILYIEDDPFIRQSAIEYLSYYCDNIFEAQDGLEGFEKYKEIEPDIIISDIQMPKLDGLSLVEKIRKEDDKTQIIILTAHADTDYLLKAVELKLLKYLVKPVSESTLLPVLKNALEYIEDKTKDNIVHISELYRYDKLNQTLFKQNTFIKLSKKERIFLDLCANNLNRAVTYSEFSSAVWDDDMSEYALSSLVKSLRSKLPPESLENISGVGYKLQVQC